MAEERPPIPEDLVPFIESGVSILVGTRDAQSRPYAMRAVGVKVHDGRRTLTVYVPDGPGARALANLRDTQRIALTFTRPLDHRSIQVKGEVTAMRAAAGDERAFLESYLEAWGEHVELVGLPRALGSRLTYWPSTAVDVSIDAIFQQTPGPSAGARLVAGSS